MSSPDTKAPLQDFRVVGVRENWYSAGPGHKQPGGSCWHCGQGIAIEVVARHVTTGEQITVGTTCAERIGLDPAGLKAMLAERYAEQRAERNAANRAAYQAEAAEREATATLEHGEHGTASRYQSGCTCKPCLTACPHGELYKLNSGCRCAECILGALTHDRYEVGEQLALIDLATGTIATDARQVDTQYGTKWVRDTDTGTVWLPWSPARRSTLAKKGYTMAWVPYLVERRKGRHGTWSDPIAPLASPLVDEWGEPVR